MINELITATQRLNPALRRIAGNVGWLFFDRVFRAVVGLFIGVWVARYLGPEQFGLFSYALAIVALFGSIAPLGLDSIVVRDLVRDGSRKGEILGTAFTMKLIGGALALSLVLGMVWLLHPDDELTRWLVIIMAASMIPQAFDAIDLWFQSLVQSRYAVYARTAAILLIALVKLWLVYIEAPLMAFAWATLIEALLIASGLAVMYRISGQRFTYWQAGLERARSLLAQSWPLILSGLAIMVYMRIDQVMLREMSGPAAVGIYSAATRISEAWYFIPTAIVASTFPSIVQAKAANEHLYYQKLQRLFSFMAAAALAIAIPMTFLSSPVIVLLFGENYATAGPVLAIHIWAAVFVFFGVVQSAWFVNEGLTRLSFQRTAAGAGINILLNLLLIPLYAGVGAAVATVAAQAFAAIFFNAFRRKTRHIFFLQIRSMVFFLKYLFPRPA